MQVPIEDIIVKKRTRKDKGNIEALAESMKRFGLICPIILTNGNVLVAGGRRLEAARSIGWRTINAVIAQIPDGVSELEIEIEENLHRLDLSPGEQAAAKKELYKLKHPGFFRRIWNAIAAFFKGLRG
ncbi:MAG: ParB N-terminal domain-containing protein [Treponema sp.]|jgi:ParB family chromosome partitioning protein|nr:ParB N-terminal domain-containing protein [Treponema sp.]